MSVPDRMDERLRAMGLVETQRMAEALFAGTAARGLVAPGRGEREASDRIGHLVGADPSAGVRDARPDAYICAENDRPLCRTVEGGWQAHWILEIHLVDERRGFGGSCKRLLDLV
ncbi:hypothetical protein ABT224_21175 [Streptomyces sp. NPDC001584]|uniref:hypothetical protein n=1 Tax=Streptomyces sp. NPDC001584 TaxID=3154521 RepID=UPI00333202A4